MEHKTRLTDQVKELEEQMRGFFGRKTEAESIELLLKYQQDIRNKIPEMQGVLHEEPVFGAIALIGEFNFNDSCKKLRSLLSGSSAALFEEIQANRSVQVSESACPTWEVIKTNPETACAVIGICFLGSKRAKVRSILNKIKQHTN